VRELWAQAMYALESWREPQRLAPAAYWLVVLVLYVLFAWSAQPVDGAGMTTLVPALREGAHAAVALACAWWLASRVPLRTPLACLIHVCAGVALGLAFAVAMQRGVVLSGATSDLIAATVGLYGLFLGVRWAASALRGPEETPAQQLAFDLVRAPAGAEQHRERFVVRRRGREVVVPARDVDWIQAAGRNVVLHLGPESYRVHESMQAVEQSLDPRSFVRVHRSRIVNLDRIRAIYPWASGDFRILMQDGSVVNFSRRYRSRLEELIG